MFWGKICTLRNLRYKQYIIRALGEKVVLKSTCNWVVERVVESTKLLTIRKPSVIRVQVTENCNEWVPVVGHISQLVSGELG